MLPTTTSSQFSTLRFPFSLLKAGGGVGNHLNSIPFEGPQWLSALRPVTKAWALECRVVRGRSASKWYSGRRPTVGSVPFFHVIKYTQLDEIHLIDWKDEFINHNSLFKILKHYFFAVLSEVIKTITKWWKEIQHFVEKSSLLKHLSHVWEWLKKL